MAITFEKDGKYAFRIMKDGEYFGSVHQNPDDIRVVDPGKWQVTIHLHDGGIYGFGSFDTADQAKLVALNGIKANHSFEEWSQKPDAEWVAILMVENNA